MTTPAITSVPTIDPATVRRVVLPNGLTVIIKRDTSAPVVAIVTYVKAGYFDETDDVQGIAHVLEHMFFKGTTRRGVGEIAKETKASGGYLNAHTIYDHTSYYTVLPAAGFPAGLDIQADAYANSVIDADELARELEVIIQEAKRKTDNPSAVASETLYEILHDKHRIRRWRIGHEAGLRALRREHMVGFYRNFYQPSNTILVVVGDVDTGDALRRIEATYGSLPAGTPRRTPGPQEPAHHNFRFREWTGDIQQAQMLMGWRTPGALDADTAALDVAASVLSAGRSSRLYRAVRERQLASSVSAFDYTPTELGVFAVHIEGTPDTAADAARAAWAQVRDLRDNGPGEWEMQRVRRIIESRWVRRLESMEGQANHLAEWEALGGWEMADRYLEDMLCVTPAQIREVTRRWLDPHAAGVAIYRPERAAPIAGSAEAMLKLMREAPDDPLPAPPPRTAEAAPPAIAPPMLEREEAGVKVYRASNGLPILVRQKPGALIAHVGVFFAGGAVHEGHEHAGLTTLLARTATKGTETRTATQLAEDAELLGGSLSPSVAMESFGWTLSVPVRHVAAAIELVADVVEYPTFPEDALDTERAIALSDVRSLRDDMYRYPMRLALEAAYGAHPYGSPVAGTETSLGRITVDDVRRWHGERVMHGVPVVCIVGDVDGDEVARVAARHLRRVMPGQLPQIIPPAWPAHVRQREEARAKAQTALTIAFPGPSRRDESRFAAQLLAGVASGLGGRFFDELRDRQSLAYTVHAFASERLLSGMFAAYIATSPEKEAVARSGLLAEFAKLRESLVSDEELQRAKTYAIGTHAIRQESGAAIMGDVVDAWMFGSLAELDQHDERVWGVTAEAIRDLARRDFDEDRRVEGVVRGENR